MEVLRADGLWVSGHVCSRNMSTAQQLPATYPPGSPPVATLVVLQTVLFFEARIVTNRVGIVTNRVGIVTNRVT